MPKATNKRLKNCQGPRWKDYKSMSRVYLCLTQCILSERRIISLHRERIRESTESESVDRIRKAMLSPP